MATRPDPDPFEDLYREHRRTVYRSLLRDLRNREDAEDATQSTFLQAFGAYRRGSRPERPRAWLLTIARNLRRRGFRRERREEELPLDETLVAAPPPDERVEHLRDALEALPQDQRAAVVLREVGGLSYAEIGGRLGASVGSVQMLLFRARRTLRDELTAAGRRSGALVPGWLSNLLQGVERLAAPIRGAGAVAAAAVTVVAVGGAGSATPPAATDGHPPTQPARGDASQGPSADEALERQRTAVLRRARVDGTASTFARPPERAAPGSPAATPSAGAPAATLPRGASVPEEPVATTTPPLELPPTPSLPPPPSPPATPLPPEPSLPAPPPLPPVPPIVPTVPELPIPEPPPAPNQGVVEGATDPQLDGVLAGR